MKLITIDSNEAVQYLEYETYEHVIVNGQAGLQCIRKDKSIFYKVHCEHFFDPNQGATKIYNEVFKLEMVIAW